MSNITNYVTKNKSPSQRASDRWVYQGTYTNPTTHEKLNVSVIAYLFTSSDELEDDEDVQFHLTRSQRVAKICQNLSHPNILKFYGTCTFEETTHPSPLALVFARHSKGDLSKFVPNSNLDLTSRVSLMRGIARGLDYLHSNQIVHGKLSPQVILINDDGVPVLSEFGRSKMTNATGQTTQAAGTARYSAPEAWSPRRGTSGLSFPADIYSFGMISLFILTGKIPFYWMPSDVTAQYSIQSGLTPPRKSSPQVSDAHWSMIESCWEKAESRPSAQAILQQLRT